MVIRFRWSQGAPSYDSTASQECTLSGASPGRRSGAVVEPACERTEGETPGGNAKVPPFSASGCAIRGNLGILREIAQPADGISVDGGPARRSFVKKTGPMAMLFLSDGSLADGTESDVTNTGPSVSSYTRSPHGAARHGPA